MNPGVEERVAGLTYWDRQISRLTWQLFVEKYWLMHVLVSNGSRNRELLRTLALQWPGALREAEMCSVRTVAQRFSAACAAASQPVLTGRDALERGWSSIWLWLDLHLLLGDIQKWRRSRVNFERTPGAFLAWRAHQPGENLWPELSWLEPDERGYVDAAMAYRWLARWSGLGVQSLYEQLFDRQIRGKATDAV